MKKTAEAKKPDAAPVPLEPSINIDGAAYKIAELPPEIQEMIALYQRWDGDRKLQVDKVREAQMEAAKCDAACRALGAEMSTRIKALNAPVAANDAAAS